MSDAAKHFRTTAFGGFHKQDVLNYITEADKHYQKTLAEANGKLQKLTEAHTALEQQAKQTGEELEQTKEKCADLDAKLQEQTDLTEQQAEEIRDLEQRWGAAGAKVQELEAQMPQLLEDSAAYSALKDRMATIELEAHCKAQAIIAEAQTQADQTTAQAREQAEETRTQARSQAEQTLAEAREQAEQILAETRAQAQQQADALLLEAQARAAEQWEAVRTRGEALRSTLVQWSEALQQSCSALSEEQEHARIRLETELNERAAQMETARVELGTLQEQQALSQTRGEQLAALTEQLNREDWIPAPEAEQEASHVGT